MKQVVFLSLLALLFLLVPYNSMLTQPEFEFAGREQTQDISVVHPFARDVTYVEGGTEFAMLYSHDIDGNAGFIGDDNDVLNNRIYDWPTALGMNPSVASGDFDGDGLHELITASSDASTDAQVWANNYSLRHTFDAYGNEMIVATGDVDSDSLDEIIIIGDSGAGVRDDANASYAEIDTLDLSGMNPTAAATGDLDWDGDLDIVVVGEDPTDDSPVLKIFLFHRTENSVELVRTFSGDDFGNSTTTPTDPAIAVGDVDADAHDEIVVAYDKNLGGVTSHEFIVINDELSNWQIMHRGYFGPEGLVNGYTNPSVAFGDHDADGSDEIFFALDGVGTVLFGVQEDYYGNTCGPDAHGSCENRDPYELLWYRDDNRGVTDTFNPVVGAGDVNHDASEELFITTVSLDDGSAQGSPIWLWLGIEVWEWQHENPFDVRQESFHEPISSSIDLDTHPTLDENNYRDFSYGLATGDFDNDATIIAYTGNVTTFAGDPVPLVVVAAPPYTDFVENNEAAMSTAFGEGKSTSESESTGTSFSWGAGVWFEAEAAAGVGAKGSLSSMFTRETAKTNTDTETRSEYVEHVSGFSDDSVIYAASHWRVFEYQIISDPDPTAVGEKFLITEPFDTGLVRMELTNYNDINGDAQDIGDEVFSHTVGRVSSYMNERDLTRHVNVVNDTDGGWFSQKVQVAQGTGEVSVELSIESESTETTSWSESWSLSEAVGGKTEFKVFGVGVEAAGGVQFEQTWGNNGEDSITRGTNTVFRGTVGDIRRISEWSEHEYQFGIAVYNQTVEGLPATLQVVNYYVEGYHGTEVPPTFGGEVELFFSEFFHPKGITLGAPSPVSWAVLLVVLVTAIYAWRRKKKSD